MAADANAARRANARHVSIILPPLDATPRNDASLYRRLRSDELPVRIT